MAKISDILDKLREDLTREKKYFLVRAEHSIIFLTYRCTSRCKTCNIWKRKGSKESELNLQQWEKALQNMKNSGLKSVEIFGGDALLKKEEVFGIIRYCRKNNIKTYFPTNSILLDKNTASALVNSGLNTVYFSLDDTGSDNDRIRGVDSTFNKVRGALENILAARGGGNKPKIVICTTVSRLNYRHIDRIIEFLKDYPVDAVYPRMLAEFTRKNISVSAVSSISPDPFFIPSDGVSNSMSFDEFKEFREKLYRIKRETKHPYVNSRAVEVTDIRDCGKTPERCLMAGTVAVINPNGDVIPCLFYKDYVIGNLLKEDFGSIWGSKLHRTFINRQRKKKIPICSECMSRVYYPSFWESVKYYSGKLLGVTR